MTAPIETFSAEQLADYRELFAFADRQSTGGIALSELGFITRSAGFNPSEAQVKEIQADCERHGIAAIDFQHFLQILMSLTNEIEDEIDIIEAFRVFDKEGQGFITREELRHIMTHLGEKLSSEEADDMVHEADFYGDGKIRYEEFVKIMTQLN